MASTLWIVARIARVNFGPRGQAIEFPVRIACFFANEHRVGTVIEKATMICVVKPNPVSSEDRNKVGQNIRMMLRIPSKKICRGEFLLAS